MRFLILLVATTYAVDKCYTASAEATANSCCVDLACGTTVSACDATTCPLTKDTDVPRQWGESWDLVAEACRLTPFVKADCDKCKTVLRCDVDMGIVVAAIPAGGDDPADCAAALAGAVALGASVPACVAAAGLIPLVPPTCAADDGAFDTLATGDKVYDVATGGTCTEAIYNGCAASLACADFLAEYAGKVTAPAASPSAASDADGSGTGSPAAMISAGIALIALLF